MYVLFFWKNNRHKYTCTCKLWIFFARVLKYKICHERSQFLKYPSPTSTFFPVGVVFVDRVASLSKFEYKCANRSRWNNVVNYSLKTRLCQRSIRQFHAHNTRWILQLAAIAVIDRTVSNDRVASCGIFCVGGFACTRPHTCQQTMSVYYRGTTKNITLTWLKRATDTYTGIP